MLKINYPLSSFVHKLLGYIIISDKFKTNNFHAILLNKLCLLTLLINHDIKILIIKPFSIILPHYLYITFIWQYLEEHKVFRFIRHVKLE